MVFSAKTSGSEEWKAIISAVSTLVEEATFEATVEGISFRGMDPSHVALIDISWPNSAFEKYECDSDIKFGVRIDEFAKLINSACVINAIEINTADHNMLRVTIEKKKRYKTRLIESDASDDPLPKKPQKFKITRPSSTFDNILRDIDVVSDYLIVTTSGSQAEFSGKGDSGEVKINLEKAPDQLTELKVGQDGHGQYSLEYLNPIIKAVGTTVETVTCEFSTEKPLRIEFKVANIGRIHFYLAPRVES